MTTAERREKEEQWAIEILNLIRGAFAYGNVSYSKGLYIAMNRDSYEILERLGGSTFEKLIISSPSIYGLPIRIDPDLATGCVRINKLETLYEFRGSTYCWDE